MALRSGLFMGSAGENGNYLEAWKTYTIFATQISKHGVVVQLVRIPACHAGGRGFESRPYRKEESIAKAVLSFCIDPYHILITLDALKYIGSLLLALTDVRDGGVCWDNKLTLRR